MQLSRCESKKKEPFSSNAIFNPFSTGFGGVQSSEGSIVESISIAILGRPVDY